MRYVELGQSNESARAYIRIEQKMWKVERRLPNQVSDIDNLNCFGPREREFGICRAVFA